MKIKEYRYLVLSDLYRIHGNTNISSFIKEVLLGEAFKHTFWMRTCHFTKKNTLLKYSIYPFARLLLNHFTYKYGISIHFNTRIGSGFYIGHFGGIVINDECIIGKNCNISQGVTLGKANRGKNRGYPILGDHVYIGPGAKVIGAIKIGNNVAIGANCVVTKNIPDNSVVVGIPGKIISQNGTEGYINRTDYKDKVSI